MFVSLINNIAFLIALAAAGQVIIVRLHWGALNRQLVLGLLFGAVALLGMVNPVVFATGMFFDGRSIVLSVAGVVGGGVTAVVAAAVAGSYRYLLGGAGVVVGMVTVVLSAALGVLARAWWRRRARLPGVIDFVALGVVVQLMQLAAFTRIPDGAGYPFIERAWWILLLLYPVATVLLCMLFRSFEQQFRDNKALAVTRNALETERAYLHTLVRTIPDLVWLKDVEGRYLACNSEFEHFFGAAERDIVGKTDYDFVPRDLADFFRRHDRACIAADEASRNEEWITYASDGRRVLLDTTKVPMRTPDGRLTGVLGIGHDITEQRAHEEQLEHAAHFDRLTGLPNRVLLCDRLHQAMAQAHRREGMIAVAYLDLDGFKAINDQYGHDAGDRLLIALAACLKNVLRDGDTIARLGGDEFVAVLLDLPDVESSAPMLSRLVAAAAEAFHENGRVMRVSASLGVAFYPQQDPVDADQLLRQADQAMYQAKLSGKNRYHIFDEKQDRSVRGHHEDLLRLKQALQAREFVLFYQPKVNMRTGAVIGVEALIRWQHPERGLLPPLAFLPLIDHHPLAIELGEWVLGEAMQQIGIWKAAGLQLTVSVNIDAIHLEQGDFVERLRAQMAVHPTLEAGDLELEVLETSALGDVAHASGVILACSEIGVGFALDDFGTGYSSLTYLKRLPADMLKIDQSFVRDMLVDDDDLAILVGILGLAKAFGIETLAEGVETVEHGEALLKLGCDLAQGYAIARPMPAADIPAWLAHWCPPEAWLSPVLPGVGDQGRRPGLR